MVGYDCDEVFILAWQKEEEEERWWQFVVSLFDLLLSLSASPKAHFEH
jgi:hypothetical protein